MNDWLPIVVGLCVIALALGVVRFAPHSSWAQELRRSYGVRPSGERGIRTRRDHLRSAGLAAVAAVVLGATSLGAAAAMVSLTVDSAGNRIALTYTFAALLLAVVAALVAARALSKALVWRIELPDTPVHRRGLADAIDHLLDGELSPEERVEFLDVRYLQPQLEQIRRATLKLVAQHQSGVPEDVRAQVKQWTAGIRASAGDRS